MGEGSTQGREETPPDEPHQWSSQRRPAEPAGPPRAVERPTSAQPPPAGVERGFRNATSVGQLLSGIALLAFALGGLGAALWDLAGAPALASGWLVWGLELLLLAVLLTLSLLLIRGRPRTGRTEGPTDHGPRTDVLLKAARLGAFFLMGLGAIGLLAAGTASATMAIVLVVAGFLGILAAGFQGVRDANLRATGAALGVLVGALLFFAQWTERAPADGGAARGLWTAANLGIPFLLGPLAIMAVSLGGLGLAYRREPGRGRIAGSLIAFGAVLFGAGLVAGSANFLLADALGGLRTRGPDLLLGVGLATGALILPAAGIAILAAALLGLVRAFSSERGEAPPRRARERGPAGTT